MPKAKILIIITWILFLVGIAGSVDSAFRNIHQPRYFESISSIEELGDSLTSQSTKTRLFAVKRMAQLKDPQAVPLLIKAMAAERPLGGIDSKQGLRYYAVIAIGEIGGSQAESYLLNIAEAVHRGDSVPGIPFGLDYMNTSYGIYRGLARIGSDTCRSLLNQIYSNSEMHGSYRAGAYAGYQRVVLKDLRFATPRDSLYYLVDQLRNTKVTTNYISPGQMSVEFIRTNALNDLIIEYGQDYLAILEEYRYKLSSDDSFIATLDKLIPIVKGRIEREKKEKEFIEKGWLK